MQQVSCFKRILRSWRGGVNVVYSYETGNSWNNGEMKHLPLLSGTQTTVFLPLIFYCVHYKDLWTTWQKVTVFKNQKLGVVEPVDEFVELPAMPEEYQGSRAVDLESTDTDEDQRVNSWRGWCKNTLMYFQQANMILDTIVGSNTTFSWNRNQNQWDNLWEATTGLPRANQTPVETDAGWWDYWTV